MRKRRLCAPLQIFVCEAFHLHYLIFSLLSASLQCCLVAWSSSSIVQGYQSTESSLQLRPPEPQAQEGVELVTDNALGTWLNYCKFPLEIKWNPFLKYKLCKADQLLLSCVRKTRKGSWACDKVIGGVLKNHGGISYHLIFNRNMTHTE